jgi:hypothetical protein
MKENNIVWNFQMYGMKSVDMISIFFGKWPAGGSEHNNYWERLLKDWSIVEVVLMNVFCWQFIMFI